MSRSLRFIPAATTLAAVLGLLGGAHAQSDDGIIRLRPVSPETSSPSAVAPTPPEGNAEVSGPRRGFDYNAFEARLESLWFQRKTLLADGRYDDSAEQARLIRAFCTEEGVHRVENLAAALVSEADRFVEEGQYRRALDALQLAESFDPGRPQVYLARADVYRRSGQGYVAAVGQLLLAARAAIVLAIRDLTLFNQLALVFVAALAGCVLLFAVLMLLRYQVPFRHEIEEWTMRHLGERWARASGWTLLLLPFVIWIGAGWIALYWIVITFRFMRRGERLTAVCLILFSAAAIPIYRLAVNAYGMTADPVVRTTLASAGGEYDPDRILKLRRLVHAHPDDPVYRFLLAGLFKNGRYFEDAFAEYREVLAVEPSMEQAHINIGNIFFATGQFAEAIASYNSALAVNPRSVLALYNRHLAQSESFRFREAEKSLEQARAIDAEALTAFFASSESDGGRRNVVDATLRMDSIWQAALATGLRKVSGSMELAQFSLDPVPTGWLNPLCIVSLAAALALGLAVIAGAGKRFPARRCIRCGRPFCHRCKSSREGHEYCSQCLHLFVLGDGLAPETKTRKLYEVERHERLSRGARKLVSLVLPGAAQIMRGRAARGTILLLLWFATLIALAPDGLLPLEHFLGFDLRLGLVRHHAIPAAYDVQPLAILASLLLVAVWFSGNAWRWRRKEL